MAKITSIVCDICGAQKKETNHWYTVAITANGEFVVIPTITSRTTWNQKEEKDVCGSDCASKALARFLSSGNLDGVSTKEG